MSYEPGRMGLAEATGLTFAVLMPRVFLTTPALGLDNIKSLIWVAPLVDWAAAAAMFFLLARVTDRIGGDLYAVSERLLGRAGAWAAGLGYAALFFIDAVLLLRQYAENTLLTALPYADFNVIVAWYIFFAAVLLYFGIESIARAAYLLIPFVAGGVITVLLLLSRFYDPYRLLPWAGEGAGATVGTGLALAGFNLGGMLLFVLAPRFQTTGVIRTAIVFGGGGSALLRALLIFCFVLAFGVAGGAEKTLPFFEMSRLVYLSRFIQRIESLFIVIWVFSGLLAIAIDLYVALYLLTRVLRLPALRPLAPAAAVIAAGLAAIPPDISAVVELDEKVLTMVFSPAVYGGPAALWAAWRREGRRKA